MYRAFCLASVFLLSACNARSVRQHIDLSILTYQRDARTGECFAVIGHSRANNPFGTSEGFTITWAPCSAGVLAAISQGG